MDIKVVRLRKLGKSAYISIPPDVAKHLRLNYGDALALRCVENKMVLERIPVESIARLRAPQAEEKVL